ncbi:hypothetical protein VB711_03525 [Cronbergia sp. UHCC 0137]|uniref:hypothetical protein n=1 Tax=Cronbergia sp. UHCC 0137 TaxID=3110239 RepID=UPI002B213283|nr:hypothetical protein [Cronbergia sp. UHCC 0137]MEA5616914.1 hypothetical protein [Cronbergia sp. UHCC 0137]
MTNQYPELRETGFFFYCSGNVFSFASVCLADGLNQLGIPVFSNIDYEENLISDFKFQSVKNLKFSDQGEPKYIIYDLSSCSIEKPIELVIPSGKIGLALSMSDVVSGCILKNDIPFFCTHYNEFLEVQGWRLPWAFGLSSKMVKSSGYDVSSIDTRKKSIVYNFRPSLSQSVRECLDLILIPHLEKYFTLETEIVGEGRWTETNLERLKRSFGCLAYGGTFSQDLLKNDFFETLEDYSRLYKNFTYLKRTVIDRWDSWRFWESLAAGCLTFHLDFEKYGFKLPVMPNNWEHYIGLNLEDIKGDIERVMDESEKLPIIAANGRKWALEHYSPIAVAERFLSIF